MRKSHDHYLIAPQLVEKEVIIVQKIYNLDRDSFLRCGIDSVLYLYLLRNSIPLFKEILSSIQQDNAFYQPLLQTVPNVQLYTLSVDNEVQQNLTAFFTSLQEGNNRNDLQFVQNALRNLFTFRNTKVIVYSAVFSILRLSLLMHPTDAINEVLIDYCFSYVRKSNLANSPFNLLSKKECMLL